MLKQILDILEIVTGVGAVGAATLGSYKWLKRRSSVFLFFKKYCEHRFFYFRSFVNKLIQKNIAHPLPDGRFINYSLALRNGLYAEDVTSVRLKFFSRLVDYQMPYKIEIDYISDPDMRLFISKGQCFDRFRLDVNLLALTEPILNEFLMEKPNTTDGPALRLKSIKKDEAGSWLCELQRASYFDQVRTNLTLDIPLNFEDTMRILDLSDVRGLKSLNDSVMANTIGVSAIWFTQCPNEDKHDRIRFFMMPRKKTTGVFSDMLGTISGVVEPPVNDIFDVETLEDYAVKEIIREFYQETGYDKYMEQKELTESCFFCDSFGIYS